MFASYNKNNAKGTLVGNWVEEDALRADTGFSRRKVPAPHFAPDMKASRHESTHDRVLVHPRPTDGGPASGFETTNYASTRYSDFAVTLEPPGPRSSRRDMELLERAKHMYEQQEQQRQLELQSQIPTGTVTKSSYLPLDTSLLVSATRVPRGRNGARVVDPAIQHLTKAQADSIDQMKLELLQGNAVTRYSYAVATGVGLDFATTASDSANPFGRSSAFTNEIQDPSKRHGEATEPGSAVDERVGTNVHQRAALKRLVAGFRSDTATATKLVEALASRSVSDFIEIRDFRAAWSACHGGATSTWMQLQDKDVIHIFMHFDVQSIGAIHLPTFVDYCYSSGGSRLALPLGSAR